MVLLNAPPGRAGELLPAVARIIELIQEIETDVAKYGDQREIAAYGPRFRSVREANTIYYRDLEAVRPFTKMPKGDSIPYRDASSAFLQLAATCLKIAVDYQIADQADRKAFSQLMNVDDESFVFDGSDSEE